jgi:hypothetical protein
MATAAERAASTTALVAWMLAPADVGVWVGEAVTGVVVITTDDACDEAGNVSKVSIGVSINKVACWQDQPAKFKVTRHL